MSKERTIRAAAIFLAMILAFGNTSSVMAAEAGEAIPYLKMSASSI